MQNTDDLGKLILRVVLGGLILLHGIAKIMAGPAFVISATTSAGLPAAVGYLVYLGEVIAPILLIVGVWSRLAALIIAGNMVFAVVLVHTNSCLRSMRRVAGRWNYRACSWWRHWRWCCWEPGVSA